MQRYFLIWPLTDDAARLADVFAQQESEAPQDRVCKHWSVPGSGDVSLKSMDSTGASLSFISNDGTQLITDELKDRLKPDEERQLILPSYEERRRTIIWTPPSTESL